MTMAKRELKVGHKAPSFRGRVAEGKTVQNGDFEGKNVVLFFYPKDNTSG
jgi:peroxiredoxin Q/BCP